MLVFNSYSKGHGVSFLLFLYRKKVHAVGKGMLLLLRSSIVIVIK